MFHSAHEIFSMFDFSIDEIQQKKIDAIRTDKLNKKKLA